MTSEFTYENMLDAKTDRNEPFQVPLKGVAAFVVTDLNEIVSDTCVLCVVGTTGVIGAVCVVCGWYDCG